jgi:hypothetical protein
MKKILIVSYHYPPMNVIAARRTEAYANFFYKYNIYPTIVTHRWEMENCDYDKNGRLNKFTWKLWRERDSIIKETYETHRVLRVPRTRTRHFKYFRKIENLPFVGKFCQVGLWMKGFTASIEVDSYNDFKAFLWKHLRHENYDMILGLYSPHSDIKLCHDINREFKIPFIADYRDLWDNGLLAEAYNPTLKQYWVNKVCQSLHKRWLKSALFFTAVSTPIADKIAELCHIPQGYSITNGFEESIFSQLERKNKNDFIILHGGTLYAEQDISGFIDGIKQFWKELGKEDRKLIRIIFLAIKTESQKELLIRSFPGELPLEFVNRLPREEAIQLMKDSSILFYPAWKKYKGIYSGKLFEYLGTKNNILVIPKDNGVVENLIEETKGGLATNSSVEMVGYLKENFRFWKQYGQAKYQGDADKVQKYSREFQVGEMARLIHKYLP